MGLSSASTSLAQAASCSRKLRRRNADRPRRSGELDGLEKDRSFVENTHVVRALHVTPWQTKIAQFEPVDAVIGAN